MAVNIATPRAGGSSMGQVRYLDCSRNRPSPKLICDAQAMSRRSSQIYKEFRFRALRLAVTSINLQAGDNSGRPRHCSPRRSINSRPRLERRRREIHAALASSFIVPRRSVSTPGEMPVQTSRITGGQDHRLGIPTSRRLRRCAIRSAGPKSARRSVQTLLAVMSDYASVPVLAVDGPCREADPSSPAAHYIDELPPRRVNRGSSGLRFPIIDDSIRRVAMVVCDATSERGRASPRTAVDRGGHRRRAVLRRRAELVSPPRAALSRPSDRISRPSDDDAFVSVYVKPTAIRPRCR